MIAINNVSYYVNDKRLLFDVTATLRAGRINVILGPNGAGKSTLLKMLSGEIIPSDGHVAIEHADLKQWNKKELARRRAVVTQFNQIGFPYTVAEVVAMGLLPLESTKSNKDRVKIQEEIMMYLDVLKLADRIYSTLSGGEQQRVAIARALVQVSGHDENSKPCYLLLDEPTASLDLRHQHELLLLLQQLASLNYLIVVVLHDINLALQYADTAILMNDGEIDCYGEINSVLTSLNINRVFGVEGNLSVLSNNQRWFHVNRQETCVS